MQRIRVFGRAACVGLAALTSGAASTAAQDAAPDSVGVATTRSSMMMKQVVDGHAYELHLRDGEVVRASVDGLELTLDQVRVDDEGHYEITDEAGAVLATFRVSTAGGPPLPFAIGDDNGIGIARAPGLARFPGMIGLPGDVSAPPRSMIGIQHAEPDEQLRENLGLRPGEARVLLSVLEGMPAAEAGVRSFDVIVAIDGKRPVTSELLTEVLNETEPGASIELTLLRKGEKKTLEVATVRGAAMPGREAVVGRFWADEPGGDLDGRFLDQMARLRLEADRLGDEGDRLELLLPRIFEQAEDADRFRLFINPERFEEVEEETAVLREEIDERFVEIVEEFEDRMRELVEVLEDRDGEIVERNRSIDDEFRVLFEELEARDRELEERFEWMDRRLERLLDLLEAREPDRREERRPRRREVQPRGD
ncbi:MAG: PDZ domain-containing protein [Planctomycetota bacterium]